MPEELLFAIVTRKSPTKGKGIEISRELQLDGVLHQISIDFKIPLKEIKYEEFYDFRKGDDPDRPELLRFFSKMQEFDYVYCYHVDRWSRSFLGLMWFEQYFKEIKNPMLRFVIGMPDLYMKKEDGSYAIDPVNSNKRVINSENYLLFFMMEGVAQAELERIRFRTNRGRAELRKSPDLWKQKYAGRKKGAKNKPKKAFKHKI